MHGHPRKFVNWCQGSNKVIILVWCGVSYDGVIKTATRNYQQDILTNLCSKTDHGYSNRNVHLRDRPKLRNSGLKIMYLDVFVVPIGRQPDHIITRLQILVSFRGHNL